MTDKQIIIDGVDVSGCACYVSTGECTSENVYPDYCKACSNCTYKLEQQLKQAEQTVEACHKYQAELEDKLEAKEQECDELKEKYKWYEHYKEQALYNKNLCNEKSEQLDQLKAENKVLKKNIEICWKNLKISEENKKIQHEHWFQRCSEIQAKANDFEQTLAEIKKIAKEVYDDEETQYQASGICYEILQKISEVEDD